MAVLMAPRAFSTITGFIALVSGQRTRVNIILLPSAPIRASPRSFPSQGYRFRYQFKRYSSAVNSCCRFLVRRYRLALYRNNAHSDLSEKWIRRTSGAPELSPRPPEGLLRVGSVTLSRRCGCLELANRPVPANWPAHSQLGTTHRLPVQRAF